MASAQFRLVLIACAFFVSLVLGGHTPPPPPLCQRGDWRPANGYCNNVYNPNWGIAGIPFSHLEGVGPLPDHTPNERVVSNKIFAAPPFKTDNLYTFAERRTGLVPDYLGRNHLMVAFGQMVSHDLGLNPTFFDFRNIFVNYQVAITESNDALLEPNSPYNKTGIFTIRSLGPTDENGIFHSLNDASSFLDAAPIYGHVQNVTDKLRSHIGGRMLTHNNTYLPRQNEVGPGGVPNECGAFGELNQAGGDQRVDENIVLTAVQTLWMNEHNYWADYYAATNPQWDDEHIFQKARARVIAEWQHIVLDELMPTIVGPFWYRIGDYDGYDDSVDATVSDSFSTAAMRLVHSMVPLPVLVLDDQCNGIQPPLTPGRNNSERANCVPDFFFAVGFDAVIRGAVNQFAQAQDHIVADGLRNVLQKPDSRGGNIDIETSNIFRGREHRLVRFNDLRAYHMGKSLYEEPGCYQTPDNVQDPLRCFELITINRTLAANLQSLYGKVSKIDAYVGLLVESHRFPYTYPPTASHILLDQFERVRAGDWWWYENRDNGMFSSRDIHEIKSTSFADVLRRHTNVPISDEAFSVRSDCPLL